MTAFFAAVWSRIKALFATPKRAATTTGAAAVLAAAAAFVGPWEGERNEAYLDRIASPPVWTVCYGETRGVQQGDRYASAQCQQMLIKALETYHAGIAACVPALPQQPGGVQVALTSWTYNVGIGAACGSTAGPAGQCRRLARRMRSAAALEQGRRPRDPRPDQPPRGRAAHLSCSIGGITHVPHYP